MSMNRSSEVGCDRCRGGCGIDFAEFPEMRHGEDECPGPECTCYEVIGGHQMGCYFYGHGLVDTLEVQKRVNSMHDEVERYVRTSAPEDPLDRLRRLASEDPM